MNAYTKHIFLFVVAINPQLGTLFPLLFRETGERERRRKERRRRRKRREEERKRETLI